MKVCLLAFVVCCFSASAQNNLTVVYHHTLKIISFPKQKLLNDFDIESTLYGNGDSVSFYTSSNQKPVKEPWTIGSRKDHHASYFFPKLQRGLAEYAWKKPFRLEEYASLPVEWKLHDDTLRIAGYLCKVAVGDGLVAWYAPDIPVSLGPQHYSGLPGLILMIENHAYRQLIKAVSVKFNAPRIVLPDLPLIKCGNCASRFGEIKKIFSL